MYFTELWLKVVDLYHLLAIDGSQEHFSYHRQFLKNFFDILNKKEERKKMKKKNFLTKCLKPKNVSCVYLFD